MKTKCEKLAGQIGKRVDCEFGDHKGTLNDNWQLTGDGRLCCPICQKVALRQGLLLASII